jgi:hypothetical protein
MRPAAVTRRAAFRRKHIMKRVVVAAAAVCLGVCSVLAASPKIEAALKTFKAVAADPGKLKTFCEMDSAMEAASEKGDKAAGAKVEALMKQLGPDFLAAWNAGNDIDEKSADGKAYAKGIDTLIEKCP